MIRIIITMICVVTFFIASLLIFLLLLLIGLFSKDAKENISRAIVKWAFGVVTFIAGTKTTVIGLENIPKDEPVLFIGNHRGIFDIIISYKYMERKTGIIAKLEIKKVIILNVWMKFIGCLFLDRNNIKEGLKTILAAIDSVKNDKRSMMIYPEGTRNKGEGILEFKEGSFKIAEKSGCKIVPMVQCNTESIMEKQFPKIRKAKTVIEFGKPIDINELDKETRKKLGVYVHDIMLEMYEKNLELIK